MLMDKATILIAALALIVSILSYRFARTIKANDLRIEANKARIELGEALDWLKNSHSQALSERKALNAARGLLNSGATQRYEDTLENNDKVISKFEREFDDIAGPNSISDKKHLEGIIVDIHSIKIKIDSLQRQYDQGAEYNERERVQLREDRRSRASHQS